MGQIIRGPFNLIYGGNTLSEISSLKFNYSVDTTDTATVQGHKKRTYGAHEVTVTATFLESDIPSLAIALPQYFVANGSVLSTGETVTDANGAIDIVPGKTATATGSDLLIEQSAETSSSYVLRVLDAISEISSVSLDEKSEMVDVEFTGQSDLATIQMFLKDAISVLS
jgi:hypothetical protein